jgi:hypothetical protein
MYEKKIYSKRKKSRVKYIRSGTIMYPEHQLLASERKRNRIQVLMKR